MGVVADIARTWRQGPRPVVRDQLAHGPNEARALAFLMLGCALVFVAQWPGYARIVQTTGDEFARLAAYGFLGWLVIWPLAFYALALLAHALSRATGGQGTLSAARLALFWSWLAATPLALLTGALAGFTGPSTAANLSGIAWMAVFGAFWWLSQSEAARGAGAAHA